MAQLSDPRDSDAPGQLHGWKDISTYFGRSVRTVQRWERDFGLPIRRFGMGRAELVHAYLEELDRWKATAEAEAARRAGDPGTENGTDAPSGGAAPPASGERRLTIRLTIPAALLVVSALALVIAWLARGRVGGLADREVAVWGAVANRLIVKNASGEMLWDYEFPFTISNRPEPLLTDSPEASVRIDDVDGDGRNEVLVRTIPADGRKEDYRFYCFDSAGDLRWTFAVSTPRAFGGTVFAPPFPASRILLVPRPRPGRDVWLVSVHSPWFPSVMTRLEPDGRVSAEYWSNGYITVAASAVLDGRRVLLVGARSNESGGASLALLDAADPSSAAPSASARYRCDDCPPGRPDRFVQFVKPARLRALRGTSAITRVHVDGFSRVVVWINHGHDVGEYQGEVIYTLDSQLRPLEAALNDGFQAATDALVRRKLISAPPSSPAIDEVRTVRWWDGTRFIDASVPAGGQ
ncbi:MAG: hypothetical protein R6V57_11085 [Vicinamibacterales bacterium]